MTTTVFFYNPPTLWFYSFVTPVHPMPHPSTTVALIQSRYRPPPAPRPPRPTPNLAPQHIPSHLRHFSPGVPRVHVQHPPRETAKLVLAVQDLDSIPSPDALALYLLQIMSSDKVAPPVGITTTGPAMRCCYCCCYGYETENVATGGRRVGCGGVWWGRVRDLPFQSRSVWLECSKCFFFFCVMPLAVETPSTKNNVNNTVGPKHPWFETGLFPLWPSCGSIPLVRAHPLEGKKMPATICCTPNLTVLPPFLVALCRVAFLTPAPPETKQTARAPLHIQIAHPTVCTMSCGFWFVHVQVIHFTGTNLKASLCMSISCHARRAPCLKSFLWILRAVVKPMRSAPAFLSSRMAGLCKRRLFRPAIRRRRAWRCRPR